MPVIKKRRRPGSPNEYIPKSKKRNESYEFLDYIGYKEDHFHVLYKNVPDSIEYASEHIAKNVVSLLNGDGGILAYGVQQNGIIYGDKINRHEQDMLTHGSIDNAIRRIIPIVEGNMYSIHFNDVVGNRNDRYLKVVRIKVAQAHELYEDINHHVYQRRRSSIYGPYSPHEIKDDTIKKMKQFCVQLSGSNEKLDAPPPRKSVGKSSVVSSRPSKYVPVVKSGLEKNKQSHLEGHKSSDKREGSSDKRKGSLRSSDKDRQVPRDKENKVPKSVASKPPIAKAVTSVSNNAPPPTKLATALSNKLLPPAVLVTSHSNKAPPPTNPVRAPATDKSTSNGAPKYFPCVPATTSAPIKSATTSAPPMKSAVTSAPPIRYAVTSAPTKYASAPIKSATTSAPPIKYATTSAYPVTSAPPTKYTSALPTKYTSAPPTKYTSAPPIKYATTSAPPIKYAATSNTVLKHPFLLPPPPLPPTYVVNRSVAYSQAPPPYYPPTGMFQAPPPYHATYHRVPHYTSAQHYYRKH